MNRLVENVSRGPKLRRDNPLPMVADLLDKNSRSSGLVIQIPFFFPKGMKKGFAGWPILYETAPSLETLERVLRRLLKNETLISAESLDTLYEKPRAWVGNRSFRSTEITRSRWSLIFLTRIHDLRG